MSFFQKVHEDTKNDMNTNIAIRKNEYLFDFKFYEVYSSG